MPPISIFSRAVSAPRVISLLSACQTWHGILFSRGCETIRTDLSSPCIVPAKNRIIKPGSTQVSPSICYYAGGLLSLSGVSTGIKTFDKRVVVGRVITHRNRRTVPFSGTPTVATVGPALKHLLPVSLMEINLLSLFFYAELTMQM